MIWKIKQKIWRWTTSGLRAGSMSYRLRRSEDARRCLSDACDHLQRENTKLMEAIGDALMHLNTNYDVDGNSMADSDAADCLNKVISNVPRDLRLRGKEKHEETE